MIGELGEAELGDGGEDVSGVVGEGDGGRTRGGGGGGGAAGGGEGFGGRRWRRRERASAASEVERREFGLVDGVGGGAVVAPPWRFGKR